MSSITAHTKNDFSKLYHSLRKAEGRIYTDEEVALLPVIGKQHKHYNEWAIRKLSGDRLIKYLKEKDKGHLQILEVGCGNGWLAAKLTALPESSVTGIDVNVDELDQAKRVFKEIASLQFFNCSLEDELIKHLEFDVIVLAASIQYFSSLENVLNKALSMLKPGGEIHLIDSNFYSPNNVEAARQRTAEYYRLIGFPEMIGQYFHHSKEELNQFDHEILYDPYSLINRFKINKTPFYWIKINA